MNETDDDALERQLFKVRMGSPPGELRGRVLAKVHDELSAGRWERRFARAAVILLAIGVGINAVVGLRVDRPHDGSQVAGGPSRESLVDAAVAVAEATDPETGRQYARQLAALSGRSLTLDQASAIDEAIEHRNSRL
jgi:hypothetical protein